VTLQQEETKKHPRRIGFLPGREAAEDA
jgi:hypothetical protein